ncbi:uncharacterized protein K460DRAFT_419818 [Cucurbitaria berberidis CBS 394.84]|uniref:Uncharacterized protein n=1 Tax=Cucurbitaria berberidis CBS 394.84 TaxID=1168544 RepID=A0A9P4L4Z6_9PLEO|nr:uncharacterized protein K460DRAFT_419818 [Cucurbitaria berberidis CBS 394.84]KAF1841822.1 hypothetical protein K460DRAFT_419818 [Cucurbitaria berberidis CBS 394.84]
MFEVSGCYRFRIATYKYIDSILVALSGFRSKDPDVLQHLFAYIFDHSQTKVETFQADRKEASQVPKRVHVELRLGDEPTHNGYQQHATSLQKNYSESTQRWSRVLVVCMVAGHSQKTIELLQDFIRPTQTRSDKIESPETTNPWYTVPSWTVRTVGFC